MNILDSIIYRFRMCKLLLSKLTPQIDTCGTFALIHRYSQTGENFDLPDTCVPS